MGSRPPLIIDIAKVLCNVCVSKMQKSMKNDMCS
jgi:hypothetical protein